jgi:hypothetical protein
MPPTDESQLTLSNYSNLSSSLRPFYNYPLSFIFGGILHSAKFRQLLRREQRTIFIISIGNLSGFLNLRNSSGVNAVPAFRV